MSACARPLGRPPRARRASDACRRSLLALVVAVSSACAPLSRNDPFSCGTVETVDAPLQLAHAGIADARIVVADGASETEKHAAEELRRWLNEITGARFVIQGDLAGVPFDGTIYVGRSRTTRTLGLDALVDDLGPEAYALHTVGRSLFVSGSTPRGTLYGVYGLLGEHLGCRWYTSEVTRIPHATRPVLQVLHETRAPAFEYRDVFVEECFDGDWAVRNRVNSSHARLDARHGGRVEYAGFVHTFDELLPAAENFAMHPEYYSEIGGKRVASGGQLCCTNEDVVRLVTEAVLRRLREHPEATIASVSQNDCFGWCQCATCAALAKSEGSQAAPVLQLVNRVAEAVEREFPGKLVDTLAYQWTRHPPRTLRTRSNVIVRLCSIECCFSHSFEGCDGPANRAFVADLRGWARVCDRLWTWDYVTDFAQYLLPFPDLDVLDANLRTLAANHVTGVFEEGDYDSPHGELQALRGWVLAQCLWDPRTDGKRARDEFLDAVYERAAAPLRRSIDALQRAGASSGHAGIFQGVDARWIDDAWLADADAAFDDAERRVADDATLLARVRAARLPSDYVVLERARLAHATPTPALRARAERWLATAHACGLRAVREGESPLAACETRLHLWLDGAR